MHISSLIILLLVICIIIPLLSSTTEQYTDYSQSNTCGYVADQGLVCLLRFYDKENDIAIKPHNECPKDVQSNALQHILKEWNNEIGKRNSDDYISRNWHDNDVMYIMTKKNEFIGCVAVDRKQFYVFISHLYVVPNERNKGYSKLLLDIAETYTQKYGMSEARLWCKPDLRKYYETRGYKVENLQDGQYIMVRRFIV
jgi:N-acetylglutamate synthase-like GNAT family acetyltransferase